MTKLSYTVVIEWEPEGEMFVATVPAFPVSTYGETWEEALEKVKEAIAVTIEGLRGVGQKIPHGDGDKVGTIEVTM